MCIRDSPSTEDMLNAIEHVNAKTVFILPNNKNIIMAANPAVDLVEDKQIIVIPTKTIPQGITALVNYIPVSYTHLMVGFVSELTSLAADMIVIVIFVPVSPSGTGNTFSSVSYTHLDVYKRQYLDSVLTLISFSSPNSSAI